MGVLAGKCVILVLGVVLLVTGLYSHFGSSWTETIDYKIGKVKVYELCEGFFAVIRPITCPPIALELYFVAVVIISFVLSVANFVTSRFTNTSSGACKVVDIIYHMLMAGLLLLAGASYIISAVQIENAGFTDTTYFGAYKFRSLMWLKIVSGSLALLLGLLNGLVGVQVCRFQSINEPRSVRAQFLPK